MPAHLNPIVRRKIKKLLQLIADPSEAMPRFGKSVADGNSFPPLIGPTRLDGT